MVSGRVLAVQFQDEFTGPPSSGLMGCRNDEVWTAASVGAVPGLGPHLRRLERHFGLSPERVCAADPVYISALVERLTAPKKRFDEPDQAWEQRAAQLRDENGFIPPDALTNALQQRQRLIDPPPGAKANYMPLAAGLSAWTWIGPATSAAESARSHRGRRPRAPS